MEQRDIDVATFQGYVTAKLEDIAETTKKTDTKLDTLEKCFSGMKVKVACIGGTISLVVTILILLLTKHL